MTRREIEETKAETRLEEYDYTRTDRSWNIPVVRGMEETETIATLKEAMVLIHGRG